jgi:hypothetical protein
MGDDVKYPVDITVVNSQLNHRVVYLGQPSLIVWKSPSRVYTNHISLRLSTAKALTSYVRCQYHSFSFATE